MAVLPSRDSATAEPCSALPTAPVPTSFDPCWLQTPPLRVNTHAAPAAELSSSPPTIAVLPSADSATEKPCSATPTAPVPTSFGPCWVQTPPLRVKTHAAPAFELSTGPPTMAVLPSADSATAEPCWAPPTRAGADQLRSLLGPDAAAAGEHPRRADTCVVADPAHDRGVAVGRQRNGKALVAVDPIAPVPTSFDPCWLQTRLLRVNTHAAPATVVAGSTHDGGVAVGGQRHRVPLNSGRADRAGPDEL